MQTPFIVISLILLAKSAIGQDDEGIYKIGTGISDITGPAAGIYKHLNGNETRKLMSGIHTRLYARSFIVESLDNEKSVVFVSCDLEMFDHGLKQEAIKKLKEIYGNKYTAANIQISATNTHSSPAGYMQYYAFVTNYGFKPVTFWAIVDGIVESVTMAHNSLTRGRILLNKGHLTGFTVNNDPDQYNENPQSERDGYDNSVDTEMISLKFEAVDANGSSEPIGSFNWWPVRPISFHRADMPLISSDSPGYASVKFDNEMNKGDGARPGRGKFVSAFPASYLADVNPQSEWQPPHLFNMTEKLEMVSIVGGAQFEKAFELFNDDAKLTLVKGPIKFVQQYVEMPNETITNPEGGSTKLCRAALGYSFLGLEKGNMSDIMKILMFLTLKPTPLMSTCQAPKPVALSVGEWFLPWKWAPSIVDLNILRIGNVDIVSVPGEMTTMAGRRLKKAMEELAPNNEVIISGLANNYINSIATPEEYSKEVQGFAGASTLFGKYTLLAIIEKQKFLMTEMIQDRLVDSVKEPIDLTTLIGKLRPKPRERVDVKPSFVKQQKWGDVVTQPPKVMHPGDALLVRFLTPSLRHDPKCGNTKSYFLIQTQNENNEWIDVRTDADLDTTFYWNKINNIADVYWLDIPDDIPFGNYRVYHSGCYLEAEGAALQEFSGVTETFKISDTIATDQTTAKDNSARLFISFTLFLFSVMSNVFSI